MLIMSFERIFSSCSYYIKQNKNYVTLTSIIVPVTSPENVINTV